MLFAETFMQFYQKNYVIAGRTGRNKYDVCLDVALKK